MKKFFQRLQMIFIMKTLRKQSQNLTMLALISHHSIKHFQILKKILIIKLLKIRQHVQKRELLIIRLQKNLTENLTKKYFQLNKRKFL